MRVSKEKILLFFFVLSIFHNIFLLMFLLYLCWIATQSIENSIKSLILIAIRTILNPKLAVPIASFQMLKWIIIFGIVTLILIRANRRTLHTQNLDKVKTVMSAVWVFAFFVFIISFINSSYPVISVFKVFSFVYVFSGIIVGVCLTSGKIYWSRWIYKYMSIVMWSSLLLALFPQGYYLHTNFLQGATDQSNMLGIISALYVSLTTYLLVEEKRKKEKIISLIIGIACCWMSNSRTGMLSIVIILTIWFFVVQIKRGTKIKIFLGLVCVTGALFLWTPARQTVLSEISDFIYKSDNVTELLPTSQIFASREGQKQAFLNKFNNNILYGSGFQTPFEPNVQSWEFRFDLIVEPGNIAYALLGDLGIVGFFLFSMYMVSMMINVRNRAGFLVLLAPLAISLGEMVFFSVNNFAAILYVLMGIALFEDRHIEIE